jgi:hypothetical protein
VPGFESVAKDVVSIFATEFAAAQPTVAIYYENAKPASPDPALTACWVRISVRFISARMPELGSRLTDNVGRVTVQVFVPQGDMTGRAAEIADSVRNIFQGRRHGDARCYETEVTPVGDDPAGIPYYQINVSTKFFFESVPA